MAGRVLSAKLWTVPSMSPPVSVMAIEAASSAPLAATALVVGASLAGGLVVLGVLVVVVVPSGSLKTVKMLSPSVSPKSISGAKLTNGSGSCTMIELRLKEV